MLKSEPTHVRAVTLPVLVKQTFSQREDTNLTDTFTLYLDVEKANITFS